MFVQYIARHATSSLGTIQAYPSDVEAEGGSTGRSAALHVARYSNFHLS